MSVVAVATTSCERDRSTPNLYIYPSPSPSHSHLLGSWKVKRPSSSRALLRLKVAAVPLHTLLDMLYITLHKSPLSICRLLVELTSATFSRYWYKLYIGWVGAAAAISIFRFVGSLRLIDAQAPLCLLNLREEGGAGGGVFLSAHSGSRHRSSLLHAYTSHSNRLCPIFKALNWIIDFQLVPAFDFLYFCSYVHLYIPYISLATLCRFISHISFFFASAPAYL